MSLFPNILTKSTITSFSAPSSASSSRRQTQQNLALTTLPSSSSSTGYVVPSLDFCNAGTPPKGISVSRRSSTVDDCGRFCALPQSDGAPEVKF